ncbi:MAG: thioredoxin [Candidatus Choladocola sp.]|nr:thioredoxin [Candidatus Choladocola sp.]
MLFIKSQEQFEQEILHAEKTVMVDFYADWCGPCKAMAPLLEEMDDPDNSYDIAKINVDELPELAQQYRVVSIPTVLVFKDGSCINRSTGLQNRQDLEALLP